MRRITTLKRAEGLCTLQVTRNACMRKSNGISTCAVNKNYLRMRKGRESPAKRNGRAKRKRQRRAEGPQVTCKSNSTTMTTPEGVEF